MPNRRQGKDILWQIGVADGSVREFRSGRLAMQHGYMLWLDYARNFPNDVNFTVGLSDPAMDWNFMQPLLAPPNTTTQITNTWKTHFRTNHSLTRATNRTSSRGYKRLVLTIGILSANSGATTHVNLDIILNSRVVASVNNSAFRQPPESPAAGWSFYW